MNNMELIEELSNSDAQIERLFWLPAIELIADKCDDFTDMFDGLEPEEIEKIFNLTSKEDDDFLSDFSWDAEEFIGWLAEMGRSGFVAQLSIPVKRNFTSNGVPLSFSYGHVHCPVVYADTFEELISKIVSESKECEDGDREEWKKVTGKLAPATSPRLAPEHEGSKL